MPTESTSLNVPGGISSLVWYKNVIAIKDGDEANRPAPRSCHTLTVAGTNAFLFGGMTHYSTDEVEDVYDVRPGNEVYRLNLSNKSNLEWMKVRVKGGVAPLPRWRHSATLFENTQIMVFGGFHTTDHRLNDVWVYDSVGSVWLQPNEKHNREAAVPCQLANNEWANVPPPRAGHSATLVGQNIYIFGGYGGLGYSRRDLDDLHALNIYSWTWSKVTPKGTAPEKRSGHQAVAVESKIYIFGGSNNTMQFQDIYVLDVEPE
eukprot:gene27787-33561_t